MASTKNCRIKAHLRAVCKENEGVRVMLESWHIGNLLLLQCAMLKTNMSRTGIWENTKCIECTTGFRKKEGDFLQPVANLISDEQIVKPALNCAARNSISEPRQM